MNTEVIVETGARLHFGLLAVKPPAGRSFGGCGVMIDQPGWTLRFRCSSEPGTVGGERCSRQRIPKFLEAIQRARPLWRQDVQIEIVREIGGHLGLGSGTQLGLAVAKGIATFHGDDQLSAMELAALVGRGARSAIGVHGFDLGGFLVEGGQVAAGGISPLVHHSPFPDDWRWVLITPPARQGLSGAAEVAAFQDLPVMPTEITDRLCRILLMQWIPALTERGFDEFSQAMWDYGQVVGDYFACVQGGQFADPTMANLAHHLRRHGIFGIAQTSWGPTMAVVARHEEHAREIVRIAREFQPDLGLSLVKGRNRGATARCEPLQEAFQPPTGHALD